MECSESGVHNLDAAAFSPAAIFVEVIVAVRNEGKLTDFQLLCLSHCLFGHRVHFKFDSMQHDPFCFHWRIAIVNLSTVQQPLLDVSNRDLIRHATQAKQPVVLRWAGR